MVGRESRESMLTVRDDDDDDDDIRHSPSIK